MSPQQLNTCVYEEILAPPTEDDLHYSRVNFLQNDTDPFYSTVQPQQPQEQEPVVYAVVS